MPYVTKNDYAILVDKKHANVVIQLAEFFYRIKVLNEAENVDKNISILSNEIFNLYSMLLKMQENENVKLLEEEKLAIEQAKVILIEILMKKLNENKQNIAVSNTVNSGPLHKRMLGYLYSTFGMVLSGINGFIVGKALLEIIPYVTDPISIAMGAVFGLVESVLFIGIDSKEFSKALGVSPFKFKTMIVLYRTQLETTEELHKYLLSNHCITKLSAQDYIHCQRIVNLFNLDIKNKNTIITIAYKESTARKAAKWAIAAINGTLNFGSGILIAKGIFCLFGVAALTSTPIGWAISATLGVFSLSTAVFFRRKSIFNFIDTMFGDPKLFRQSQEDFINGENGIKRFDAEINSMIAQKQKSESNEKALINKINFLEEKVKKLSSANLSDFEKSGEAIFSETRMPASKRLKRKMDAVISTSTASIKNRLFFRSNRLISMNHIEKTENNYDNFTRPISFAQY